jgi:hypothetical protein
MGTSIIVVSRFSGKGDELFTVMVSYLVAGIPEFAPPQKIQIMTRRVLST